MLLQRLQRFMDEERPQFVPYIPGDDETETRLPPREIDAAHDSFVHHREMQLLLLEKADDTKWPKPPSIPHTSLIHFISLLDIY